MEMLKILSDLNHITGVIEGIAMGEDSQIADALIDVVERLEVVVLELEKMGAEE